MTSDLKYPEINKWYDHEVFGRVRVIFIPKSKDKIFVENIYGEKRLCCGWDGDEKRMLQRFLDL